uniref:Uncharacterized protein n=1 Tax=Amphora coffeiformis TaxID=265554 RepID=A0A7S3P001_9STRA|mmetsp:Transcript_13887/g.26635  ORF Transcript_13887/g.26635 Transcript_13887/m.26635 type:complete len:180 (-) Transcript_13887:131-670(-)
MACVCRFYKNGFLNAAQVVSVVTFVLVFWNCYWGPDICAALAMLLLWIANFRDNMKARWFYVAIALNILSIIGCAITMIFWDNMLDFCDDEEDSEDEDGLLCDKGFYLGLCAIAIVLNIITAGLTWLFMTSPKGYAMYQATNDAAAEPSGTAVSPIMDQGPQDEEAPKAEKDETEISHE